MAIAFEKKDWISIDLGAKISGAGLIYDGITAQVVEVREKAIQIKAETRSGKMVKCWFPKKAFTVEQANDDGDKHKHYYAKLRGWFDPQDWTGTFIEITREVRVL